jgi:hypothetical protein
MRRPCLSDWRTLRLNGFGRRHSLVRPDICAPDIYKGFIAFAAILCEIAEPCVGNHT